jgi:hypothetical protein
MSRVLRMTKLLKQFLGAILSNTRLKPGVTKKRVGERRRRLSGPFLPWFRGVQRSGCHSTENSEEPK